MIGVPIDQDKDFKEHIFLGLKTAKLFMLIIMFMQPMQG